MLCKNPQTEFGRIIVSVEKKHFAKPIFNHIFVLKRISKLKKLSKMESIIKELELIERIEKLCDSFHSVGQIEELTGCDYEYIMKVSSTNTYKNKLKAQLLEIENQKLVLSKAEGSKIINRQSSIKNNQSSIEINPTFKQLIPPLTAEEYRTLEQNILSEGIRDPLCIWNGVILDGHNRYAIAQKHNLTFDVQEMNFADENEAKIWMIKNQFGRRNISKYTRIELALELKPMIAQEAKKNQGARTDLLQNLAKSPIDTRKEIAKIAGLSPEVVRQVQQIIEHAPQHIKEQLRRNELSIFGAYKDLKRKNKRNSIKTTTPEMPEGLYSVIYADPPWKYDFSETKARKVENHYPTMELHEIKNLQIPAAPDAVLFLWATAPKLPEALEVMNAWGFQYKTSAAWDKQKIGNGYWFRGQHELLLVGVKGDFSPPLENNRPSSLHSEPRRQHSRKPDYYYQMIEQMIPAARYLELFARRQHSDKWAIYANQTTT